MSNMEKNKTRIKDFVESIVDNRGRNPDKYYDQEAVPVIDNFMIKNTLHPDLTAAERFLNEEQYKTFLRGYIEEDDVLVTLVGGIGNVTLAPKARAAIVQNTIGLKTNKKIINNHFFYYYLCTINQSIKNLDRGVSQPSVNRKDFLKLKIDIPKLEYQHKVAKILRNYDQIIENNNKRIKILEQMAENLYKEWFVRFRFPGYENTEFENGIPKEWTYFKFSDLYKCERGISYSTEEIEVEEGENLINLKNIQSFGGFRRDGLKKYNGKYREQQKVSYNDLVMGVTDMTQDRRTVGAVALIPKINGVISADLVKLTSKINNVFSYCLFRFGFYSKLFSQFGNGANVIHLKPSSIKNQKILIPTQKLVDLFVKNVEALIEKIENLNLVNDNLAKQRDALLPRLMSGKLEIK